MISSVVLLVLATLVGCGGGDETPAPGAGALAEKPFLPRDITTGGMEEAGAQRERGKFVAEAGEFTIEATLDGEPVTFRMGLDLVALRLADIPTLEYPIGYVKLDAMSLDGGDVQRDRRIADTMFRTVGSPVQIIYDVGSVGEMKGRLPETGGDATGKVIGTLQVDDRQIDLDLPTRFHRADARHLALEIEPVTLRLEQIGLSEKARKLAGLLGASLGPTVKVSGSLGLIAFDGPTLPTFPRTPVTIARTEEVRQKIDAEIDDGEAVRQKLLRTGTARVVTEGVTNEYLEKGDAMMREAMTGGKPVLRGGVED